MIDFDSLLKGKTVVVGIGNPLREDDYIGCYIAENLKDTVVSFNVEVNPEVFIDDIVNENPDTIIIFDAADFGGRPGEVRLIEEGNIDRFTLSSHTIPISFFIHLLKMKTSADIYIIGIQPESTGYREGLSGIVRKTGVDILKRIKKSIKQ
ncbi:hydrogenase 3 maturation endopeptidase HyCI [bacterium]|mgnify:CR=1 FL=1|nr:MAG: hydrogenase 3 maturation endopeptidase HyCI [bacterium]